MTHPPTLPAFARVSGVLTAAFALLCATSLFAKTPRRVDEKKPILAEGCEEEGLPSRVDVEFGEGSLSLALSQSMILENSDGEIYLSIELLTHEAKKTARPPLNLALVIDRSGSMSGDKIAQARTAAAGLVSRLGSEDTVSLVQYDDYAQILVPPTRANAKGKATLEAAIEKIYPGGSTNLHDGMQLGLESVMGELAAGQVNRVILLSDGRANVGIIDTPTLAAVASASSEKGIRITTVGMGLDYNEDLMAAIANNGLGNYYYVRDAVDLDGVFAGELSDMQATVATQVELHLTPGCSDVEIIEVFGYSSRQEKGSTIVGIPDLAGGEKRKVVMRLKAPSAKVASERLLGAKLLYKNTKGGKKQSKSASLGLSVSSDKKAVTQSADKDVMAQVLKIESALALRKAAEQYEKGDAAMATKTLKEARERAQSQAKVYNFEDDVVEGALQGVDLMYNDVQKAKPSSSKGKDALKRSKSMSIDAMH